MGQPIVSVTQSKTAKKFGGSGASKLLGPGLVALVFLYIAVITLNGHKQFSPNYDLLQDTGNAQALLHKGWIPTHGSVSSFYAFNPPGVSWGMVPGLLIFPSEAALAERVGSLLLLALTLAGLYFLLAGRFGVAAAVLACMVYALSGRGFFFATSLWPRAHPVFLVWFLYFADRWTEGRRYGLALALTVWFAGAYWMMEGVTAILIIPLLWAAYRPPIRWREVCFATGIGALIWSPYLTFETPRGFMDLRALLTRTSTRADYNSDVRNSLSNPGLIMVENRRPPGAKSRRPFPRTSGSTMTSRDGFTKRSMKPSKAAFGAGGPLPRGLAAGFSWGLPREDPTSICRSR